MSGERYALTVRSSFSAAHRLPEYQGNCERLHGHNWRVDITVESDTLDFRGMALDFRDMKTALGEVLARMDHRCLNDVPPFDVLNPSSENIARHVFDEMEGKIRAPVRLSRVIVWESEDAWAEYSRPGR